jgi:solute carrier family 25 phosphate transporter 23/24/25/41
VSVFSSLFVGTSSHLDGVAGVRVSPSMLSDFMTSLTASPHSHSISFQEFRDFLLLLPRRVSTKEIYRFYELRKFLGDDGRGAARVTMEGTLSRITPRGSTL